MAVKIVVSGITDAAERIARAANIDEREFLDGIGGLVESQIRDRFNQGRAPAGDVWKPKRDGSPSFLQQDGGLLDSIHFEVSGNQVEVGSNKLYAGVHQEGATIKPKSRNVLRFRAAGAFFYAKSVNVPARPFVGLSGENQAAIQRFAENFVAGTMEE